MHSREVVNLSCTGSIDFCVRAVGLDRLLKIFDPYRSIVIRNSVNGCIRIFCQIVGEIVSDRFDRPSLTLCIREEILLRQSNVVVVHVAEDPHRDHGLCHSRLSRLRLQIFVKNRSVDLRVYSAVNNNKLTVCQLNDVRHSTAASVLVAFRKTHLRDRGGHLRRSRCRNRLQRRKVRLGRWKNHHNSRNLQIALPRRRNVNVILRKGMVNIRRIRIIASRRNGVRGILCKSCFLQCCNVCLVLCLGCALESDFVSVLGKRIEVIGGQVRARKLGKGFDPLNVCVELFFLCLAHIVPLARRLYNASVRGVRICKRQNPFARSVLCNVLGKIIKRRLQRCRRKRCHHDTVSNNFDSRGVVRGCRIARSRIVTVLPYVHRDLTIAFRRLVVHRKCHHRIGLCPNSGSEVLNLRCLCTDHSVRIDNRVVRTSIRVYQHKLCCLRRTIVCGTAHSGRLRSLCVLVVACRKQQHAHEQQQHYSN